MTFRIDVKKRVFILIFILCIQLAVIPALTGSAADGDHPITLTVTCDPDPELDEGGTVPDLLFTIRNTGTSDYTLENAVLSGGYENRSLTLDERITVLAGATKEFHLQNVEVDELQLDTDVTYTLSWEETEMIEDTEGGLRSVKHDRDTTAVINIPRFLLPELTVYAECDADSVREGESFTVVYTIINDTKFDMTGVVLNDPEQSMKSIELPSSDLYAGEQRSVVITYTMGKKKMSFRPAVDYIVKQRSITTSAQQTLTIDSIIVNIELKIQQYPATKDGVSFAITVKNAGNRTVTDIRVYDEINTLIGESFDLPPDQSKVLDFNVPAGISSGIIRQVHFHLRATDCFGQLVMVTDPNQYRVAPLVEEDAVNLQLHAELQKVYYDKNGKLCGTIRLEIRNYSEVKLHDAVLIEEKYFGTVESYPELQYGSSYRTVDYQLNGMQELAFYVKAVDPSGQYRETGRARLDLSNIGAYTGESDQPVYVQRGDPFFKDLTQKLKKPAMISVLAAIGTVFVCMIVCIILYCVERRLKAKLPPAFETDMEKAMRTTQRRMENPLFKDAPTEQFGYTVPIKLRDYGELTEQEAEARRQQYARKLRENLSRDAKETTEDRPAEEETEETTYRKTRIAPIVRNVPQEDGAERKQPEASEETNRSFAEAAQKMQPEAAHDKQPEPAQEMQPEAAQEIAADTERKQTNRMNEDPETAPVAFALREEAEPRSDSTEEPSKEPQEEIRIRNDEPVQELQRETPEPEEEQELSEESETPVRIPQDEALEPSGLPIESAVEAAEPESKTDETPVEPSEPNDVPVEETVVQPMPAVESIPAPLAEIGGEADAVSTATDADGETDSVEETIGRMPEATETVQESEEIEPTTIDTQTLLKQRLSRFLSKYLSMQREPTQNETSHFGPRCMEATRLPQRRPLSKQTPKRMNG